MIEHANVTYSPLGKVFKKQIKMTKDHERKQVEDLKVLKYDVQQLTIKNIIPEDHINNKAKNKIEKLK